jgi:hypothetical protein
MSQANSEYVNFNLWVLLFPNLSNTTSLVKLQFKKPFSYSLKYIERKQQTVAAFIDISGAYDNVLIDILCDILREKEVPLQV